MDAERLFTLPCSYNYNFWFCELVTCKIATSIDHGIKVMHGAEGQFEKNNTHWKLIYEFFRDVSRYAIFFLVYTSL